ncbi:hypothetical protein [Thermoanaerobacterium sp. DL9XJH110]|uniref:hypothetical protein n=1 Tax=Thermoanaerobacterium sp. DL9XJH110 TaxID=3386643 RepID=UPI003BB57140
MTSIIFLILLIIFSPYVLADGILDTYDEKFYTLWNSGKVSSTVHDLYLECKSIYSTINDINNDFDLSIWDKELKGNYLSMTTYQYVSWSDSLFYFLVVGHENLHRYLKEININKVNPEEKIVLDMSREIYTKAIGNPYLDIIGKDLLDVSNRPVTSSMEFGEFQKELKKQAREAYNNYIKFKKLRDSLPVWFVQESEDVGGEIAKTMAETFAFPVIDEAAGFPVTTVVGTSIDVTVAAYSAYKAATAKTAKDKTMHTIAAVIGITSIVTGLIMGSGVLIIAGAIVSLGLIATQAFLEKTAVKAVDKIENNVLPDWGKTVDDILKK